MKKKEGLIHLSTRCIYYRISYLVRVKGGIKYVISHNFIKIKVDSYNSLPREKPLTFHSAIIL